MTPSTTTGLKVYVPGPVSYVQATSSCFTFDLLICLRDEYCEESAPPRYSPQVAKDRSAAGSSAVKRSNANVGVFKIPPIAGRRPTKHFLAFPKSHYIPNQ